MSDDLYDILISSGLLLLLLLANAVLVACEISLVRLRYTLGEDKELERLKKSWATRYLLDNAGSAAQVIRFGIMVSTVGLGLAVFPLIDGMIRLSGFTHPTLAIFIILLMLLAASLVSFLGFLIPRGLAVRRPHQTLSGVSWGVVILVLGLLPWFKLLRHAARRLFSIMGIHFEHDFNVLDFEVQIRALADDEKPLSKQTLAILQNALRMRELETSDVVQPRQQVLFMDLENSLEDNLHMARESGHTRFPLCKGDLDECVGLIHIKDLFRTPATPQGASLISLRRDILSFRDDLELEQALTQLLARKAHMALVKDEFGGVIGMLTLETILERLVGDIHDEFDLPETARVTAVSKDDFTIDGLTPVHEVEEKLSVEISDTEASTFGGLVTESLGRLPLSGEQITLEESRLEVKILEVDERRILSASVKKLPPAEEDE